MLWRWFQEGRELSTFLFERAVADKESLIKKTACCARNHSNPASSLSLFHRYAMMRSCWMEEPLDRPSFTELREQLEELMSEDRDYLVLEDIDVPLSASESSSNPTVPEMFSGELCPSPSAVQTASASSSGSGSSASAAASAAPPSFLRQGPPIRRLPMTIDVCIHQKSTERLMRPSESDSSP